MPVSDDVVKDDSKLLAFAQAVPDEPKPLAYAAAVPLDDLFARQKQGRPEAARPSEAEGTGIPARLLRILRQTRIPFGIAGWDPEDIVARLHAVISRVERLWQGQPGIPFLPARGPEHSLRMVEVLGTHFSEELGALKEPEFRVLLAAIFLHDIGIAVMLQEGNDYEATLKHYDIRSSEYVSANYLSLLLSVDEGRVLSNLCRFQRLTVDLASLIIEDRGAELNVARQKVLLAYLHLAERLEVHPDRIKGKHFTLFRGGLLNRAEHNEWLRNLFITGITRTADGTTLQVKVTFNTEWDNEKIEELLATIRNDLQGSLDIIKDVLIAVGRCHLLWVRVEPGVAPPSAEAATLLEDALHGLVTARSPNARRIIDHILASLSRRLESGDYHDVAHYVTDELHWLAEYRANMHQIQLLCGKLKGQIEGPGDNDSKLAGMRGVVEWFNAKRDEFRSTIARHVRTKIPGPGRFVLFGYSDWVLTALDSFAPEVKAASRVIVLECRNKSVYGEDNVVDYCDGAAYALAVRNRGFVKVSMATDVSLASVLERAADVGGPTYVLLGANGIYQDGAIVSTVGYLTVALIARHYQTPLYVIAEAEKIVATPQHAAAGAPGTGRARETSWLDPQLLLKLERTRGDTPPVDVYRPLQDIVPAELITAFITENGVDPPDQIGRYAERRPA